MTEIGISTGPYFRSDLRAAGLVAALFAMCALNLWMSFALASPAQGQELRSDLDAPRILAPRFDTESKSAPSTGRRTHSPQLTSTMAVGQCGRLTSPRERQDCMIRVSSGPSPAAAVNASVEPTLVVSSGSK